ncbi:MAG: hypothetical protein IKS15_00050 [Opitutales bacterium]|nr:hypothetical protein [Opitutales bacterium]
MPKADTAPIVKTSIARFFAILTLGIFGGAQGAFSAQGQIGRREFWRDYLLPAFYLFLAGAGAYRLACHFYGLYSLGFTERRLVFALALTPAMFTLFAGEMKRLRDVGLWGVLALVNFYVPYGALGVAAFCAVMPKIRPIGSKRGGSAKFLR